MKITEGVAANIIIESLSSYTCVRHLYMEWQSSLVLQQWQGYFNMLRISDYMAFFISKYYLC